MILNFNVGLLGHVDSGKTSLAKVLSTISSTACFDKNPQSKERGITLDLGFSALTVDPPVRLKQENGKLEKIQLTLVDCPGHSSLIRTIIGGAQIIDMMLLLIDVQKGIQTQTAECIVIGEILQKKLLVVVNKIDLLDASTREGYLKKLNNKLQKALANTRFGSDIQIFHVSTQTGEGIPELLEGIRNNIVLPIRNVEQPFLMYVDHCFSIKGQGTICTGTVVQGCSHLNDLIEFPAIKEQRKIKSMQMFRKPVESAAMGDRVALGVTQINAKSMERGVICKVGYMLPVYAVLIECHRIEYYKLSIKSKAKLHVTVGHETVMAHITLFKNHNEQDSVFDANKEYEYMEELTGEDAANGSLTVFCLLLLESPVLAKDDSIVIASKLDLDTQANCCRLAFWGKIQWHSTSPNVAKEVLINWKIFKNKEKRGTVQRFVNEHEIIVQNLLKKESNRQVYVGKQIQLTTGEIGKIESTFGQTSKVKITFPQSLAEQTVKSIKEGRSGDVEVLLRYKKYIFNKSLSLIQ